MQYPNIEKNENYDFTNLTDNRFIKIALVFLGIIIAPVAAYKLGLWEKIDPLLASVTLFTGFLGLIFLFSKSINNKILPYFLLQFSPVWVNINQITLSPAGIDLKIYAIIFGLSSLITLYYIFTNFKHLWNSFAFKCLLLFFVLNIFYAFYYSSDFRSSSYIDTWIETNAGLKHTLLGAGYAAAKREFGTSETQLLKYLIGIVPLVSFVIGYMSLYGLKTAKETNSKLNGILQFISLGYIANLVILFLCVLAGTASVVFMDNRLRINDNFTGVDFEGFLLLLLIGFNIYISNFRPAGIPVWLRQVITFNIIILSLFIILGIKKGTIISFLAGFLVIQFCSIFYKNKEKNTIIEENPSGKNLKTLLLILLILPIVAVLPLLLANQDFISDTLYNITNRFSSSDTLDLRAINWYYYTDTWFANLTWFTALFGFGTDSSREFSFFLTAMQPDKGFQQPHIHNIYLEYFYNWGFMALLYFLPGIFIFVKDIYRLLSKTKTKVVKLFSAISMSFIVFFLLYYLAESPSMISHITFFAFLGFIESVKLSLQKNDPFSEKDTLKMPA